MSTEQTPMMQQYYTIKADNPGYLLFYRMGDFYELFGDDALVAADILQITLTRRRTARPDDDGVPMCGVPFHAAEAYIAKLLQAGHKVALCEQTETPEEAKKRDGSKALVRREVIRRYTGGTLTEDTMLNERQTCFLAAVAKHKNAEQKELFALGWLELSTGQFFVSTTTADTLTNDLARINAKEVLLTANVAGRLGNRLDGWQNMLTETPEYYFEPTRAEEELTSYFAVQNSDVFAFETTAQAMACGALMEYVRQTQVGKLPRLNLPTVVHAHTHMQLDAATRRNLELTETLRGERKGSLLHTLDLTVTAAGSRLLAFWLMNPLADVAAIRERQQLISLFKTHDDWRSHIHAVLKSTADTARALSRITLGRGGPRDVDAIRRTLAALPHLQQALALHTHTLAQNTLLTHMQQHLNGHEPLFLLLDSALAADSLPLLARDGNFIKDGYHNELDHYRSLTSGGMALLQQLEKDEQQKTGINTLKIKYNKIWGYFFEVSKGQSDKVPDYFIHRQTTTNSQRFSTTQLMQLEREYSSAEANALEQEQLIFAELTQAVNRAAPQLLHVADTLAQLDVLAAQGAWAHRHNWCAPVVDTSTAFDIKEGKHPVVASTVEQFIANNCTLSNGQLWLITGPNMAGKSTFLRQNALIALLAHCGFFVPASQAHIGVVDKIFTRIGAADDLARGQSTFMVEMVETATILNHATSRSLVVLDEIGRGTATFDGMSIAWACAEYLAGHIGARGLFATHYHELTGLEAAMPNVHCHHVSVKEWQGKIVFLHQVKQGVSPGSYGIHVAKLAGIPAGVTARAQHILHTLEQQAKAGGVQLPIADLPLFGAMSKPEHTHHAEDYTQLINKLETLDPDTLTPREAHAALYELTHLMKAN